MFRYVFRGFKLRESQRGFLRDSNAFREVSRGFMDLLEALAEFK